MESMKPQEGELGIKISELQSVVSDLKAVFSSALLELSRIKDSDTCLQEDLKQAQRTCDTRTCQLEALLFSLKEELLEMRCQMLQLCCDQQKLQQSLNMSRLSRGSGPQRNCCCGCCADRGIHCDGPLLHFHLQGGSAGRHLHTGDAVYAFVPEGFAPQRTTEPSSATTAPWGGSVPHASPCEGRRMQAALELLHSEQEYVKTLSRLHDKFEILSGLQGEQESETKPSKYTEQLLRRHGLFRKELEDRLSRGPRLDRVADAFAELTRRDDSAFSKMYLGYLRTLPEVISALKSDTAVCNTQASSGDRRHLLDVFPILAPVSRIHNYMIHTQSLLQWTGKEHPDYRLLEDRKREFGLLLSQCHELLENGGLGDVKEEPGCRSACPHECRSAGNACRPQDASHPFDKHPLFPATSGADGKERSGVCGQGFLLRLKTSGEQACGQEPPDVRETAADGDTDQEDFGNTSVFDYSSVTSCSPDGTFDMGAKAGEEARCVPGRGNVSDSETDSQVPVLLKPSQRPSSPSGEASPCPRWQVPRVSQEHSVTKNLPHSPGRTFKITWDKSFKQDEFPPPNDYKTPGRQAASKAAQDRRFQR
ncbi:hypothetical protein GN956_G6395 [Arapaima gigas]